MPKVSGPLFSKEASGSVSPLLTFSLRNSGQQVRFQRKQKDKITALRTAERAKYSAAVVAWNLLTNLEKSDYNIRTVGLHMTGFNLFVQEFILSAGVDTSCFFGTSIYGTRLYGSQT